MATPDQPGRKLVVKFYFDLAPNPMKAALLLGELGAEYEPIPLDTRQGQQHTPEYLAVNPNAKVPAVIDGDTTVFESNRRKPESRVHRPFPGSRERAAP